MNLAFSNSGTIGSSDGEIGVSLTPHHAFTDEYVRAVRSILRKQYPNETFYFAPVDIETQILNFGIAAPMDIQILGPYQNQQQNFEIAQKIAKEATKVQGAVDVFTQQVTNAPEIRLEVNRLQAAQVGLTQQNVASSVLVSLASSSQTSPTYFIDPKNGVQYTVSAQTPQREINSLSTLLSTPVTSSALSSQGTAPQLLYNQATVRRDTTAAVVTHYNTQPSYDVYVSADRRDLGGVSGDVSRLVAKYQKTAPRGTRIVVSGQASTMRTSFIGLGGGLVFAILLVYLLLTVNFESFVDPVVILSAAPGALSGIVWILFASRTTFNVPSLMGAIMCIGVATANSILLVTFANDLRNAGKDSRTAAMEAGQTRLRPVLMTALAMIIGMLPMSLALGEGGEQNAPLGRAVIGGLLLATFTTLLFVPVVYSVLRAKDKAPEADEDDAEEPEPNGPAAHNGNGHSNGNGHASNGTAPTVSATHSDGAVSSGHKG